LPARANLYIWPTERLKYRGGIVYACS